ncbi:hypothetical protein ID0177_03100 [Helicobacter pylori]
MREKAKKHFRIPFNGANKIALNFTGGYRSGVQIDRNAPKRTYKYTKKDCDLILGIDTRTSECYIIPRHPRMGQRKEFVATPTL